MRILYKFDALDSHCRGASVAIGNFDGVHLGHISVIKRKAVERNIPLAVMTFEPHPREFFCPEAPPFRLMNHTSKMHRLEQLGVEILYQLCFDRNLAAMSSSRFVDEVLINGLGIRVAVAGNDFRFGKRRTGTVDELKKSGKLRGFDVFTAPMLVESGQEYSSTAVRTALSGGEPQEAARLLGHWHRIEGPVVKGKQRGRSLGFPTANVELVGLHAPKFGVYAVLVRILSGACKGEYQGVASVGVRPTFGLNPLNLEVYIFDFDENIYGQGISVAFVEFQRPEIQFSDSASLVEQMQIDCDEAKRILASID